MPKRSGRFKVADASGANAVPIISGHSGAFYRVFNSGDNPFTIKTTGGSTSSNKSIDLNPTFSVDLAISSVVKIEGAAGKPVEGIYDFLDGVNEGRSGRFKFRQQLDPMTGAPVDISGYPHKIIQLKGGGHRAYYRIFNSGQQAIEILEDGTNIKSLAGDQSFDFEVGFSVQIISVTSADLKIPIEGIYELLGLSD